MDACSASCAATCLAACVDTNGGAVGLLAYGCSNYSATPSNCGAHDDADFTAASMCCVCGGGSLVSPPPPPPSLEPIWACRASQLSSGSDGHHICTVLDSGDVKCWGYNAKGQLGIDGTSTVGNGTGIAMADLPAVTLGDRASAISAGESHTCAILNSGDLKCWGLGADGQLGYDNSNNVGGGQPYQLVMANLPAVNLGAGGVPSSATAQPRNGGSTLGALLAV